MTGREEEGETIPEQPGVDCEEATHYQVIGDEGRTPFAARLRAYSPLHDGPVLAEILLGAQASGPPLDVFRRRLLTVSSLGRPGILEADDLARLPDGTPVVISELPEGVTLARWLANGGSITTEAAMRLIEVLADALAAAHARGVCHGSISPEQVLLVGAGPSSQAASREAPGAARSVPVAEPIAPKLMGFAQRWLAAGETTEAPAGGADRRRRAEDVTDLARLAERVLTPAERRAAGDERASGIGPAIAGVIAGVLTASDEQCPTAVALARDLAAAAAADDGGGGGASPSTALARARPRAGRPSPPRFVTGLMAGTMFGLVTALGAFALRDSLVRGAPVRAATEARTLPVVEPRAPQRWPLRPPAAPAPRSPLPVTAASVAAAEPTSSPPRAAPPPRATSKRKAGPARAAAAPAQPRRNETPRPLRDLVWSAKQGRLTAIDELDRTGESPTVAVRPPPFRPTAVVERSVGPAVQ